MSLRSSNVFKAKIPIIYASLVPGLVLSGCRRERQEMGATFLVWSLEYPAKWTNRILMRPYITECFLVHFSAFRLRCLVSINPANPTQA